MNEEQMRLTLAQVEAARQRSDSDAYGEGWLELERLADANYLPVLDFCVSGLDDTRWPWRHVSLLCLGFHFVLPPEGDIISRIRRLLLHDPEVLVRMTAASVLGSQSRWPEAALRTALEKDRDKDVRRSAFAALLDLAGAPFATGVQIDARLRTGAIKPTWSEAQRVMKEAGLTPDIPT